MTKRELLDEFKGGFEIADDVAERLLNSTCLAAVGRTLDEAIAEQDIEKGDTMHKSFKSETSEVSFDLNRLPNDDKRPNSFNLKIPNGGTIQVEGTGEFVSTILRQLLEHPASRVTAELVEGYEMLPDHEQAAFREFFKIKEFDSQAFVDDFESLTGVRLKEIG